MIVIKWLTDWTTDTANAPFIISLLTNLGLRFGYAFDTPLWGDGYFQTNLNRFLIVLALISVPLMLIFKPILLNKSH